MIEELWKELAALEEVEAIALGGSRAGVVYDEKSDYDVYLYCTDAIEDSVRNLILKKYCSKIELGNHFWELEDNCTLKNGIDIDILYRNLDDFTNQVAAVVEGCQAYNGYTTCMWHNLRTCKVIYDRDGRLNAAKIRFDVPYPKKLKENIIDNSRKLIHTAMPAYGEQIMKAVKRNDTISINHRIAAFMESYFDLILAVNEMTHPGEKRLIEYCKKNCNILPADFEENVECLFKDAFCNKENVEKHIQKIIFEIEKILGGGCL